MRYNVTLVKNFHTLIPARILALSPERKLVPSASDPAVSSLSTEVQPPPRSSAPRILAHTLPHSTVPKWVSVLLPHSRDLLPNRV